MSDDCERIEKVWGNSRCIFKSDTSTTHLVNIKRGGYCSEHCHAKMTNRFVILSGKINVTVYRNNIPINNLLTESEIFDVSPDIYHRFEALEDSVIIEIYEDKIDKNDIIRRTESGLF